jgi:SpoVK/Ycf46/Vps4 family AAA+-type ATPase
LEFFLNRRDWYEQKGIPYTLGFMFHGEPGCGKTSSIKAIANTARRHIVNIQLSQIKSKEQLRHLFFNDEIHVHDGIKTERYTIPVHERLYVIEDIDAMGDSVLRRDWKKPVSDSSKPLSKEDAWMEAHREEEQNEPLDLSFLLNLLDGTLEASGRILAITSNFPERIDKALIRPGRIDMIVHFRKCNIQILKEMVNSFYDTEFEEWTLPELDYKWSPAEVNQILFRNFTTPETALEELKTLTPKDLCVFEIVHRITYSEQ